MLKDLIILEKHRPVSGRPQAVGKFCRLIFIFIVTTSVTVGRANPPGSLHIKISRNKKFKCFRFYASNNMHRQIIFPQSCYYYKQCKNYFFYYKEKTLVFNSKIHSYCTIQNHISYVMSYETNGGHSKQIMSRFTSWFN